MLTSRAKKLLMRVAEHIKEEPKRLNMSSWIEKKITESDKVWDGDAKHVKPYEFPKCKTTACIAGWTVSLSKIRAKKIDNDYSIEEVAYMLLDGHREEDSFEDLFYVRKWDKSFRVKYHKSKTPQQKANVAVAYIKHYIKTRGKKNEKISS